MRLLKVILILGLLVSMAMSEGIGDNNDVGVVAHWSRDTTLAIDVFDHRGLTAGTDVDGDGLMEVWVSIYTDGGGVAGLEMVNDSTLELIYADTSGNSYSSGTRWVQVGDLDSDGLNEVIYFAGRYGSDSTTGLYIVESTGNNTFADPVFFPVDGLGFTFNGSGDLTQLLSEHFLVDDVDGDNVDELIFASNRGSFVTDYLDTVSIDTVIVDTSTVGNPPDTTITFNTDAYGHSEDFFGVLSATGDLQSGFGTIGPEFMTSARDIDMGTVDTSSALFGRENYLGGGSAINVVIADTDGDGLKELVLHSWNNFNTTIVEATAANTYSFGDSTYVQYTTSDHVSLKNGTAIDIDGDGKDEVFLPNYYTGGVYMIKDSDGDATNLAAADMTTVLSDTAFYVTAADDTIALNAYFGAASGDIDQDGNPDIYIATSSRSYDIVNMEYDGTNWSYYTILTDSLAQLLVDSDDPPFAIAIAVADLDGDGHDELITSYQGTMGDSVVVINGTDTTTVVHPAPWWTVRVTEWDPITGVVSTRPLRVVTPRDYKLSAAYPNPFNPITSIDYTLPLSKKVSLIVYNLLGQEVVRLLDNELMPAGDHQVRWNGLDSRGLEVASGTYIYVMKTDSFTKSMRVTFLK